MPLPQLQQNRPSPRAQRQTSALLQQVLNDTDVRVARIAAEAWVSQQKMRHLDHLAEHAIGGQQRLREVAIHRAGSDINAYEDFLLYIGLAKMGKAQIFADTADSYCGA